MEICLLALLCTLHVLAIEQCVCHLSFMRLRALNDCGTFSSIFEKKNTNLFAGFIAYIAFIWDFFRVAIFSCFLIVLYGLHRFVVKCCFYYAKCLSLCMYQTFIVSFLYVLTCTPSVHIHLFLCLSF